jgi:type II secretory pathway pseudopilin PulG
MSTTGIIVLIIVIILALVVIAAVTAAMRRRRTRGLQDRFGSEYDRTVEEHGSRRQAEHRMADAADRRDKTEIRDLEPQERSRYAQTWTEVQAAFVDSPLAATRDADRLVEAVMRDRGYPVDDFNTKADMIAMDHPGVVEHYRAAQAVGSRSGEPSTEELRRGFVHYRALFDELLGKSPADADGTEERDAVDARGDDMGARADGRMPSGTGAAGTTPDGTTSSAARSGGTAPSATPAGSAGREEQLDLTREEHAAEHRREG